MASVSQQSECLLYDSSSHTYSVYHSQFPFDRKTTTLTTSVKHTSASTPVLAPGGSKDFALLKSLPLFSTLCITLKANNNRMPIHHTTNSSKWCRILQSPTDGKTITFHNCASVHQTMLTGLSRMHLRVSVVHAYDIIGTKMFSTEVK